MVRKISPVPRTQNEAIDLAMREAAAPLPSHVSVETIDAKPEKSKLIGKVPEPVSTKSETSSTVMVPHNQRIPQVLFDRLDTAFRQERIKRRNQGEKFTKNALGIEALEKWLLEHGY